MTPEEEGPDALTSGASEHPCVSKKPGDGWGRRTLGTTHGDDELICRGTRQCRQVSELRTTEPLPQWKPVCPTGAHSTAGSVTSLVPSLPLCSMSGSQKEHEAVSAPRSADDTEAPCPRSRHQSRMLAWSAPPSKPPPGNGSPESCAGSSTSAGLSQLDP